MNHSAPKILYTASSSAHLVSFHLPYLAALRSLGWDVTAAANGSGEGLGEGVRVSRRAVYEELRIAEKFPRRRAFGTGHT